MLDAVAVGKRHRLEALSMQVARVVPLTRDVVTLELDTTPLGWTVILKTTRRSPEELAPRISRS